MRINKCKIVTYFSAALLSGASAIAFSDLDEPGVYTGGSFGAVSIDNSDFDDESDVGQVFLGVRSRILGLELSYMDFDDYGGNLAQADTDGYGLAVTGHFPITDTFAIYGKAGQFWWDAETELFGSENRFDGREPYLGAGVLFGISEHLNLDLSYQRMNVDLDEDEVGPVSVLDLDSEVNIASVGLRFSF